MCCNPETQSVHQESVLRDIPTDEYACLTTPERQKPSDATFQLAFTAIAYTRSSQPNILRARISGASPVGWGIPPLKHEILIESSP